MEKAMEKRVKQKSRFIIQIVKKNRKEIIMSYDVNLLDPITKKVIEINDAHFIRGGTYRLGGSTELSLNITWNYGSILRQVLHPDFSHFTPKEQEERKNLFGWEETGIRSLYGMTALEATPILKDAVNKLADDVSENYWEATEGNVKRALNNLLTLCKMRPDAIIEGD